MSRRLYAAALAIGPARHPTDQIHDAEAFCARYLNEALRSWGMRLLPHRPQDYDDSLALLVSHLWRLSVSFDTEENDCFANYARTIIPRRAADVGPRRLLGRNGRRADEYDGLTLDASPAGSLARAVEPDLTSSTDPDRGTDERRLHAHRNRQEAWAAGVLGLGTPRLAA